MKFGDDSIVSVMGKRRVTIQTKGSSHYISNVLFVPDLKTNLLSVGQLQEKGYEISIKEGVCQILDEKLGLIAQVKMTTNRMFPLYLHHTTHSCFVTNLKDVAWLWHFRYGNLSFGGLKTLQQKNMVIGLSQFEQPSQLCEECIVSKQHRDSFLKGKSWRAKKVLELVHSDLCGPIKPNSNGGKRYFISFIDDFSMKTWVYFLQEKSEAFTAFQKFKPLAEREVDSPIKILRTYRGGEFNSQEFKSFCEKHRVRRQLIAAYTPQQNGVCERKNRAILNMVRSLLQRSGLPKSFWPEAVIWSVYILNRSPTLAVQNITPEEAWSGRRPVVDHFRVFRCIAYVHVPDEKRRKLDDKCVKCIFLGVSDHSKAYKLYDPITEKIVISREVIFYKEKTWMWRCDSVGERIPADFDCEIKEKSQQLQPPAVPASDQPQNGVSAKAPPTANAPDEQVEAVGDSHPHCVRRRPAWMSDYKVTGLGDLDNPLTHFALFSEYDPITFEAAAKEQKWIKAIDNEIASTEKNNTWELTELPMGQKTIGVKVGLQDKIEGKW